MSDGRGPDNETGGVSIDGTHGAIAFGTAPTEARRNPSGPPAGAARRW